VVAASVAIALKVKQEFAVKEKTHAMKKRIPTRIGAPCFTYSQSIVENLSPNCYACRYTKTVWFHTLFV
jgi:hypothetical protein